MNITFTRTGTRVYTVAVARDSLTLQVPTFDRPASLPHDIVHYVVERELELQHGFWGSVAAGAIFPGMQVLSGRLSASAAARSKAIIRDLEVTQRGAEIEVLVTILDTIMRQGLDNNYPAARTLLNEVWKPAKPSWESPNAEEIKRVCGKLRQAEQQWQALTIGQSLTVAWLPPKSSKECRKGNQAKGKKN